MSAFPILVERYGEGQAARVVCERCKREVDWDPGEGDPYEMCSKCADCGGQVVYKYEEAMKCGGCGTLGHFEKVLGYCCSRVCQLQAEYAAELKSRKGEAA